MYFEIEKGMITQNILCVRDFHMHFVYVGKGVHMIRVL